LPKVDLRGCRIRDIYTPRQREPYTEGKAYLYFFPDGHTERAIIHVADTSNDIYTLIVQPLTGRVEVRAGDVPVPRGFGEYDDEGNAEVPR
jgi:general secretion pathway protein H